MKPKKKLSNKAVLEAQQVLNELREVTLCHCQSGSDAVTLATCMVDQAMTLLGATAKWDEAEILERMSAVVNKVMTINRDDFKKMKEFNEGC